jgi:hypothetical protein
LLVVQRLQQSIKDVFHGTDRFKVCWICGWQAQRGTASSDQRPH